ncbi:MAG: hypothetical protein WA964_21205 [Ilumatobacter sp.]|uniref:hypothetical protein n=1 Tax=Ilumatobacter sp. TaxID=1967498 RepID=UPI003C786906
MSFPPPDPVDDTVTERFEPSTPTGFNAPPAPAQDPSIRAGDLTTSWRVMLGLGWITAFFAFAGVWQASVQIGIGTWWVGPRAQPTNIAVKLIPFYLSLLIGLLIVYNVRWIVRWSALGVAATALISIPDFSRSVGLGVAEAIIAGLLGVITLASLSGRYRAGVAPTPAATAPPPEPPPPGPAPQ